MRNFIRGETSKVLETFEVWKFIKFKFLERLNELITSLPTLISKKTKVAIRFTIIDYSADLAEARENAAEAHYQEGNRFEELKNYKEAVEEFQAADRIYPGYKNAIERVAESYYQEGNRLSKMEGHDFQKLAAAEFQAANRTVPGYKDAIERAAEAYYSEGDRLSKMTGREIQKQAAKEFKTAENICPGYKDASNRYEECRKAGILRMAIIPFVDKSGVRGKYGALSDMITDDIISNVMNNPYTAEFLEIISRSDLEQILQEQKLGLTGIIDDETVAELGRVLGLHEILTGQITQVIFVPERKTSRNEQQKANIWEKVGEEYKEREVQATVAFHKKMTSATISGSYKIIDVNTAKLKTSRSFSGDADFTTEWATYSGDERALNNDAKKLIKLFEEPAPIEAEMVSRATKNLSQSLVNTLIEYAR